MRRKILAAAALLLVPAALAATAPAAQIRWIGGDGNWSDDAEWSSPWADGNEAAFQGSQTANRGRTNLINVDGTYTPSSIAGGGGYGGKFLFYGTGDLVGPGSVIISGASYMYWQKDFSLTGTINVESRNNQYNIFGFVPTTAGAQLVQTINLGNSTAAGYYAILEGNTDADWSQTTINVSGNVDVPAGSNQYAYAGADFHLTTDVTFRFAKHYDPAYHAEARFNGNITGSDYDVSLIADLPYNTHNNYMFYLIGDLNWDVRNATKDDDVKLYVAPTDYATVFAGMRDNGGAFQINAGQVVWRNPANTADVSTLDLRFPLALNSGARDMSTVTTIQVNADGALKGDGTHTQVIHVNDGGTLYAVGTYTKQVTIHDGGTLAGDGTGSFSFTPIVEGGATISPGASVGVLGIGGAAGNLNVTGPAGLLIQVASAGMSPGVDFDQLAIGGSLTGLELIDLTVEFDDALTPDDLLGNVLAIVTVGAGDLSGLEFRSITLLSVNEIIADVTVESQQVLLGNFRSAAPEIPEPISAFLLAAGLPFVLGRRRRTG